MTPISLLCSAPNPHSRDPEKVYRLASNTHTLGEVYRVWLQESIASQRSKNGHQNQRWIHDLGEANVSLGGVLNGLIRISKRLQPVHQNETIHHFLKLIL